ncbi:MAG: biotin synthase BioB [Bdellovibrionales bacterium]
MLSYDQVRDIYNKELFVLVNEAARVHQSQFPAGEIQLSSLLSVKTGGCPENCSYCPQSAHYETGVDRHKLLAVEEVRRAARHAQNNGATRFCMGAAWREVKDGPEFDQVLELVREVKSLGLEVCCTLGMLSEEQAKKLRAAGLHAYNHNIDTSRAYYSKIISTRTYDDRLRTIANVRRAGLTVCTGGIIGMGESDEDRIGFLWQLASFNPQPESVTVNALVATPGTPLAEREPVSALELARVIASARILLPHSMIRLSAGRKGMSPEGQFICFLAGANSIFLGDTLLTSPNPSVQADQELLRQVGLKVKSAGPSESPCQAPN